MGSELAVEVIVVAAVATLLAFVVAGFLMVQVVRNRPAVALPMLVAGLTVVILMIGATKDDAAAWLALAGTGMGALAGAVQALYSAEPPQEPPAPVEAPTEPPDSEDEGV